jgi:hypothetical protein
MAKIKNKEVKVREGKPMVRINTRIREEQQKFIKAEAKKNKLTEGDVLRLIIDFYISKKN